MLEEIEDEFVRFKSKVPRSQHEKTCTLNQKLYLRKITEEVPENITRVGEKYSDQLAHAKIKSEVVPIDDAICDNSEPIENFSPDYQKIIWKQLTDEFCHYNIEDRDFAIVFLNPDILPITTIEYGIYDPSISDEDMRYDLRGVNKIYNDMENGYDMKYPIMLSYHSEPSPSLELWGGNHRLQAVRNLIKDRKLSPDFKIPSIIVCPKKLNFL